MAVIANLITKENNRQSVQLLMFPLFKLSKTATSEVAVNQSQLKFPFTLNISSSSITLKINYNWEIFAVLIKRFCCFK